MNPDGQRRDDGVASHVPDLQTAYGTHHDPALVLGELQHRVFPESTRSVDRSGPIEGGHPPGGRPEDEPLGRRDQEDGRAPRRFGGEHGGALPQHPAVPTRHPPLAARPGRGHDAHPGPARPLAYEPGVDEVELVVAATGHERRDAGPTDRLEDDASHGDPSAFVPGEEILGERRGGRVAVLATGTERALGDRGERRRGVRSNTRQRETARGSPAGEELEETGAEAVDVGPRIQRLPANLLRAHVPGRPGRPRRPPLLEGAGEPPVGHHGVPERADHDVPRLEIPMEDPPPVCVGDGLGRIDEVPHEAQALAGCRLAHDLRERAPGEEAHGVVRGAVRLPTREIGRAHV